ncbi:MAG: NHL repeat-containing protein, partial [Dehalococcoidia bacterium]
GGYGGDGGPATSALLNNPFGVAVDGAGNLYIADLSNCRVRKVAGGIISTVAGTGACGYAGDGGPAASATLSGPVGVAVDSAGNLYITDGCRVREVAGGIISTVAGSGACGYTGDGGPATSASLSPDGVAVDNVGNLYLPDLGGCRVRKVAGGIISTVAGNGTCGYGGDGGPATNALLNGPSGVAVDSAGNLYIGDETNCRVRKVAGGIISTVAGNGLCTYAGDGGWAPGASLSSPYGVAVDSAGNLYIADSGNCRVRKVAGGVISTLAGSGICSPLGQAVPSGVGVDSAGNSYIADQGNCRVRKVAGGIISAAAGNGGCGYGGDGGPATSALLYGSSGVAVDSAGNLYVADRNNCRVRKVAAGIISTVAGNGACAYGGDGGPATSASLDPAGVAVHSGGILYIADRNNCRVRKVAGGIISTFAGNGACGYGGDSGPATNALLNGPSGVALDSAGSLYIADASNCRVRKVTGGIISTAAGNGFCGFYGGDGGPATSALLSGPSGVAVDSAGDLYIADSGNCRVRKVAAGIISTVAGNGTCTYAGDGGPATSASLSPYGVAVDSAGNLYIADWANCRVRKVAGSIISTVAGNGTCGYGGDGGPATSASLYRPQGVAVDSAGNLYIADSGNNRVRIVYSGVVPPSVGGIAEVPQLAPRPAAGQQAGGIAAPGAWLIGAAAVLFLSSAAAWVWRRHRPRAPR